MRDAILNPLFSPVTRIKGVGSSIATSLARLLPAATVMAGGTFPLIRDLLFHGPSNVIDRRSMPRIDEAKPGAVATFVVKVLNHQAPSSRYGSRRPYKITVGNDSGMFELVFFHARSDYLLKTLPIGQERVISGVVDYMSGVLQMTHPDIIVPVAKLKEAQILEPVYPLTLGLTSKRIAGLVAETFKTLPKLPEWIAPATLAKHGWPSWADALQSLHHPTTPESLSPLAPERERLAYDELLAQQLYLANLRKNRAKQKGRVITTQALANNLRAQLPFTLTQGQEKVITDIASDLASGHRMLRLLQGDVGAGKTVVALFAMLQAVEAGGQAALMVPTELIASQHFKTILELLSKLKTTPPSNSRCSSTSSPPGEGKRGYMEKAQTHAKSLRNQPTEAEKKLWEYLRKSQIGEVKFRRQQPIGPYIVDFFAAEEKLIIEIDGGQHAEQIVYDAERTAFFEAQGYRVLRCWNNEVLANIEGVYAEISRTLATSPSGSRCLSASSLQREEDLYSSPLEGEARWGDVKIVLLTGSVKGKARSEMLAEIGDGTAQIIVGTHALFQEAVEFHDLALVVIDEQHRFGVNQRMALGQKGEYPHILQMTATPIPRSLSMTLYGDMDNSMLLEKPADRQPIATRLIAKNRMEEVIERLRAAFQRGEKAYWVCPMIDGAMSQDDAAAAESRFREFTARFGPIVGLVHGRMKQEEKDQAMARFASGETKLLVATTVVEVGVDVRDATIMVIEQAERFGLAQLHQLRGRVGRGDRPSACVLLYGASGGQGNAESSLSPENLVPRLNILRETEDGFKIAEADLALRGGGDMVGIRQSGLPAMAFADLSVHFDLLLEAREEAAAKVESDVAHHLLLQLFGYPDA